MFWRQFQHKFPNNLRKLVFFMFVEILAIINRPGVAGAVLQTPSSLIQSVSECVRCQMSRVAYHVPHIYLFIYFLDQVVKLIVGGSVIPEAQQI